jgi:hypothetical protein
LPEREQRDHDGDQREAGGDRDARTWPACAPAEPVNEHQRNTLPPKRRKMRKTPQHAFDTKAL